MAGQKELPPVFKTGISKNQGKQLLEFSRTDEAVRKFTHDTERFKNERSLELWKRKSYIYTLEGNFEELLGIAWFKTGKMSDLPDYPFTFAIRIYPPARGKGFAKKFMRKSFKSFMGEEVFKKSKNKKFWLKTNRKNITAINLYLSFGFKKQKVEVDEIIMTYKP